MQAAQRLWLAAVAALLLPSTPDVARAASGAAPAEPRVLLEFFFAPGCDECRQIRERVLPRVLADYGGLLALHEFDIHVASNYLALVRLQEQLDAVSDEPVSIFVDRRVALAGVADIEAGLAPAIAESLALSDAARRPVPGAGPAAPADDDLLQARLRRFTVGAVALAGLVDGINPCAFATVIFFISLLTVAGVRGARILAVGLCFGLSVFATYLALGFGVFSVLRELQAYRVMGQVLRWGMVAALGVLAVLSARDAWRFHVTGRADSVALRLPGGITRRIHNVLRGELRAHSLAGAALAAGFLVTLLESVCTGQVYVPTLVYVSRRADSRLHALALLLLYNLLFIVPLAVVTVAAYAGVGNYRLAAWSRRNVVGSKVALAVLFAALAAALLFI